MTFIFHHLQGGTVSSGSIAFVVLRFVSSVQAGFVRTDMISVRITCVSDLSDQRYVRHALLVSCTPQDARKLGFADGQRLPWPEVVFFIVLDQEYYGAAEPP